MKMFITTLLLVSSFAVSARSTNYNEALSYRTKLVNIYNYDVDLKCNALTDNGNQSGEEINELARTKVLQLANENQASVTVETDNFNDFADHITIGATYDTDDSSQIEMLSKVYLINDNKNVYKMELRIRKYKVNAKTKRSELINKALVTCVNEKI
ncbi:hypothetical protein SHI21_11785 [Bacteriovorax sp. PP10]|uniref:Uncharacterized protein n=1 Tax=Bacteriovorax antarcticus TaxID=3088717 RepID=A0ABU5VX45_9BACT|nr:hypothetical protein [Bacteriovorax sp. PP10]MEA9356894.1 hypothetical protein [Bacteriovorax sp. PP10]